LALLARMVMTVRMRTMMGTQEIRTMVMGTLAARLSVGVDLTLTGEELI
jgi:hypothetical protein